MGNNAATGHVMAVTGLPQAAGFHKTLGQMMYQYGITPWDPRELLQSRLAQQQEMQKTSPFRFIQVDEGLQFYGSQIGSFTSLNREKFVEMSMQLFRRKGLHLPVEEARLFYDIFDSIDLYKNATLSVGELAGGLSSFFGGTVEAKTNAMFELVSRGQGQVPKSALQELLKPYVWCMVPPSAEVLRPILLPHVSNEIYSDMSYANNGHITRQELQRWAQKGAFSQGAVDPNKTSVAFTIIDRAALAISMAIQLAWREYEEKYQLRDYGKQAWQEHYGNRPQYLRDVGAVRYVQEVGPLGAHTSSALAGVGHATADISSTIADGATAWWSQTFGGVDRRDSVDSVGSLRRYSNADSFGPMNSPTEMVPAVANIPTPPPHSAALAAATSAAFAHPQSLVMQTLGAPTQIAPPKYSGAALPASCATQFAGAPHPAATAACNVAAPALAIR